MGRLVIFVFGRDPLLSDGGADTYVRATGRAALRAGYEPHIFCVGPSARVEATGFGVVHCAKTPFRPIRTLMAPLHGRYIVNAVDRFAAERRGTLLIHSFGSWAGVAAAAARRLARRGIDSTLAASVWSTYAHESRGKLQGVGGAHGLATKLALRWELAWTLLTLEPGVARGLRTAKVVLANYDSVKAFVEAQVGDGLPFRKMTYASEAAFTRNDTERAAAPECIAKLEPKGAPLIVAVSRHDARKGLDVLLRALAQLRAEGVRFRACLVGGGALLAKHRALAAKLDLLSCTALPGRVPDAFGVLQHADIFTLPSIEEGSGSVALLEAMQAGVAPVVSRVDGLPEDVHDGESGLLAAPGSADDLARALRQLAGNAELRAKLGRGAHAVYRARFSADAYVSELREIYAGLGFESSGQRPCPSPPVTPGRMQHHNRTD
jgi:glycosyltransferase involved in cell wall biosynthesis